ncbi:MAG: hypothetical protein GXO64_00520 [Candidatus Micrarchaeota archaeon]|nr:hypothetical protein [Candidatus Micrarchaeota archaeon]
MGVRPIVHHKNLNPKDNRISNLVLICPNCHDKYTKERRRFVKKLPDRLDFQNIVSLK